MAMCNLTTPSATSPRLAELRAGAQISVYLSTKNTILKAYDGRFRDLFQEFTTWNLLTSSRRQALSMSTG